MGLLVLYQFRSTPFFEVPITDEESYIEWAKQLLAGGFWPTRPFYQDPLYPYLLALWFGLAGPGPLAIRLLQVGLGAASVAVVYAIGRDLLGERGGLVSALVLAGCATLYFFELQISKETLLLFLCAVSCWLGVKAVEQNRARLWLLLGLGFGLLCLVRGNFQPMAPAVVLWAALRPGPPRRIALRHAALAAAGILIVLAPVAGCNYSLSGQPVITTFSGGYNFYLGNNEYTDGRYTIPDFAHGNPLLDAADFRREAERRTGRDLTDAQASSFWLRQGADWMRDHPADAARLWARKLRLLLHQHEIPNLYSLDLMRSRFVPALRAPVLGFGLLWGPALMGLAILWRREPRAAYPALFAILYALSLLPFFIVDRYRVPLLPPLAVFSAAFFDRSLRAGRERRWKSLTSAGLLAAAAVVIGTLPLEEPAGARAAERAQVGYAYFHSGDPAAAVSWYEQARALAPADDNVWTGWAQAVSGLGANALPLLRAQAQKPGRDGPDLFVLGKRLEQLGQTADAARAFEAAIRRDPGLMRPYLHLGLLYSSPGMRDLEKARSLLERALALSPGDPDVLKAQARVRALEGASVP
jgi:4-amino-4-deoxy-L-arabinose transferase-like glycosyltransferase